MGAASTAPYSLPKRYVMLRSPQNDMIKNKVLTKGILMPPRMTTSVFNSTNGFKLFSTHKGYSWVNERIYHRAFN